MHITIRQAGGFAGATIELAAVDVERLEPARGAQVRRAVDASGFFRLPARLASTAVGADVLTYEITIEGGGRRHTVTFADDDSPDTALLRRLRDAVLVTGPDRAPGA
jgi:hypothetical protein